MCDAKECLTYEDNVYKTLKERILELGTVIYEILECLSESKGAGKYKVEILSECKYSDTSIRPALISLYSSGFIDKEVKGRLSIYKLNSNGDKLLNELRSV